jgi:hypothetical protein
MACDLPSDLAAAHAMIVAERAARMETEKKLNEARAVAANAQAEASSIEALIAHLKLQIEKLRRELYGRSERKARCARSSASGRHASRSPRTCRVIGS